MWEREMRGKYSFESSHLILKPDPVITNGVVIQSNMTKELPS